MTAGDPDLEHAGAATPDGRGPDAPVRRRAPGPYRPPRPRAQERLPFAESRKLEKEWWLRVAIVLVSPRAVFSALRDDRDAAADARQEPLIALLFFSGLSIFFMSKTSSSLYDSSDYDAITVVLEAIVTVPLTALLVTWLGGLGVRVGFSLVGAPTRWRRCRHLVSLAQAPLVLPLALVLPVRLVLYGSDIFRSGGSYSGTAAHVFAAIHLAFVAWAVGLLLIGTRALFGWSWSRTVVALAPGLGVLAGVAALLTIV